VRRRAALVDALVLAALALWAVPFFWQALTSLKPDAALMAVQRLLAAPATLDHYRAVVQKSLMPAALTNSLGVATLTTILALVLGAPGAYALARLPVPGKQALLLAVVACTAFPQVTIVGPLFVLLRALDLRDTWLALVLADTSFALPVVLWLLAGFVRDVPVAVEEAAQIDGAGRTTMLTRVVLPLIAPGMASAGLLVFLMSWNELLFAYTFTATEASRTVPVALALFPGVYEVPWGDIAAASMLASLPPILIVAGLQRWLVRGLTAGALRD
jgi:multiple sugar transport system permease protein